MMSLIVAVGGDAVSAAGCSPAASGGEAPPQAVISAASTPAMSSRFMSRTYGAPAGRVPPGVRVPSANVAAMKKPPWRPSFNGLYSMVT